MKTLESELYVLNIKKQKVKVIFARYVLVLVISARIPFFSTPKISCRMAEIF